jgi:hypothetical protein
MERGLPASATLSVRRDEGHVYDLVSRRAVPSHAAGGAVAFDVDLAPGDGRVFLVVDRPVTAVLLETPEEIRRGERASLSLRVVDDGEEPVAAVVPVRVDILDARDRPAEGSGYYAAKDGLVSISLDVAANDEAGEWTARATELASGKSAERKIAVR